MQRLVQLVPEEFNDYYEPFSGSASLFFNLAPKDKTVYLNDLNPVIANTLHMIQTNADVVCRHIETFLSIYTHAATDLTDPSKDQLKAIAKDVYHQLVTQFNDMKKQCPNILDPPYFAALFIVVMSLTYGALYVERNKDGNMVRGFGPRTLVAGPGWKAYDVQNVKTANSIMNTNDVHISSSDFETCLNTAKEGDFVFLDPPYIGTRVTRYVQRDFDDQAQLRLFEAFKAMTDKGVKAMMTNVNTEAIRNMYGGFRMVPITTSRDMSHSGKDAHEIAILNY